jgi:hypothetical protein
MGAGAGVTGMSAQLRSREVLVAWVAYCLVHAAACREHPLLLQYGVGLDWHDLRHLVLSDAAACNALLTVAAYLQSSTQAHREAFSLRDGGRATFRMAAELARTDRALLSIWEQEKAAANARAEQHAKDVQRQQALAQRLRPQLVEQKRTEAAASLELGEAQKQLLRPKKDRHLLLSFQQALQRAQAARQATEAALKLAMTSPEPVFQPMPRDKDDALTWLFFLHMPPLMRCASSPIDAMAMHCVCHCVHHVIQYVPSRNQGMHLMLMIAATPIGRLAPESHNTLRAQQMLLIGQ